MPMPPSTICSLGATAPSLPKADAGTNCGSARQAPTWAARFIKHRRPNVALKSDMLVSLFQTVQSIEQKMAGTGRG